VMFLLFAGMAFAGCASSAYTKSCSECSFDDNGKMNQTCYKAKQAGGTTCLATSHAIMSAQYAAGKCPQIDACIESLNACKASLATGNDKQDCDSRVLTSCFDVADACVDKAGPQCGETPLLESCATGPALIMLIGGFVFLSGYAKKE
jgi:hypothetical protein